MPGGISLVPEIALDSTPQLGGDLDGNGKKITNIGKISATTTDFGTVVIRHKDGTTTAYNSTADTDAARGTALVAAVAAAAAGDVIIISAHTYDLGVYNTILPTSVNLFGAGIGATIIKSQAPLTGSSGVGPIIVPGTASIVKDMTIWGTLTAAGTSTYQAAIGYNWRTSNGPQNPIPASFTTYNLECIGDYSAAYFRDDGSATNSPSVKIYNSTFSGKDYSVYKLTGTANDLIEFYNPIIKVVGPSAVGGSEGLITGSTAYGTIRVFGGQISESAGASLHKAVDSGSANATIELYGVKLSSSAGGYDLVSSNSNNLKISSCVYDLTKVSGSLGYLDYNLKKDRIVIASQISGVYGDADKWAGGGHEDSALIQAALDALEAAGGGILIADKAFRVNYLVQARNVGIIGLGQHTGFYQSDGMNYPIIRNKNRCKYFLSHVATAPSPATTGTSLTVTAGDGQYFDPADGSTTWFYALVSGWSKEIIKVTNKSGDTFTIERGKYGSTKESIGVGHTITEYPVDDNMVLANLFLNCNCSTKVEDENELYLDQSMPGLWWNGIAGVQYFGFHNLIIQNVQIINAHQFAANFSYGEKLRINGLKCYWTAGSGKDGFHICGGPMTDVIGYDGYSNGGNDGLAINPAEQVATGIPPTYAYASNGNCTGFYWDGFFFDSAYYGVRLLSFSGYNISDVTLNNFHGYVTDGHTMHIGWEGNPNNITLVSRLVRNNWTVTGGGTLIETGATVTDWVEDGGHINETTINGDAGTAVWRMPDRGDGKKTVLVYLDGFTKSGQTITYPVAFTYTPVITTTLTGTFSSTTTVLTFTTTTQTGWIKVEGY